MDKINKPCETCGRVILVHPKRKWCDGCVRVKYYYTMDRAYESVSVKKDNNKLLPRGFNDEIKKKGIREAAPDIPLPLPTPHAPKPVPNRSVYKYKRSYHHSF